MTYEEEVKMFKSITEEMASTFGKKRKDYGPSTTETWIKYGPASMCTRMRDKLCRIDNLLGRRNDPLVEDEKVQDTLLDLANYAIIALIELEKERERCKIISEVNDKKKE